MKVLILDNFDSFTYNLYQMLGEVLYSRGIAHLTQVDVLRNNEIDLGEIKARAYTHIIISPGPGTPENPDYFGVCGDVIKELGEHTPILGVCLGMQGISHSFKAKLKHSKPPIHGKVSIIEHDGQGLFSGLPSALEVMRYHSIMVDPSSVPDSLVVTAVTEGDNQALGRLNNDSVIMGIRHKSWPVHGIQFHPESFATEGGLQILENFISDEFN